MKNSTQNLEFRTQKKSAASPLSTFASKSGRGLHSLPLFLKSGKGFTLVETLLAVSLLVVAVTAPMLLTMQALTSAYYARDQITAYHLAQEGIEAVHSIRDAQVLAIATTPAEDAGAINLFGPLNEYADNTPFTVDITSGDLDITECTTGTCPALKTNGTLYGYTYSTPTLFTRTMKVCYVQESGTACDNTNETNEIRVTATVSWQTASYQPRTFIISEDLYRWINDGSGV